MATVTLSGNIFQFLRPCNTDVETESTRPAHTYVAVMHASRATCWTAGRPVVVSV